MMAGSYERINYSLRPAKSVQRKVLLEAFRRLSHVADLASYRYLGFGSPFFADFVLLHRHLRISRMVSIERQAGDKGRFEFNRPFKCIRIEFGHSNDVLPNLPWDCRTIAWLDYEDPLDASVLADIAVFSRAAPSGSVLAITVPVNAGKLDGNRLSRLHAAVGHAKVPPELTEKDLEADGLASVCRRIVNNQVLETLNLRNAALDQDERVQYQQLFNFRYTDTAKMATFGGALYDPPTEPLIAACDFDALPFLSKDDRVFPIRVPSLTFREIRYLDAQLPAGTDKPQSPGVRQEDVDAYAAIYCWFPAFSEIEY